MEYEQWLPEFTKDKKEVESFDLSNQHAVHSIRRFLDARNCLWEIALTYTGRLVTRRGCIESDGVTVDWEPWVTRHDVELPLRK